MMIAPWLSLFGETLAVLLIEAGVLGAHLGTIPPMTGLMLFLLGFSIAILAVIIGLIGVAYTSATERRSGRSKAAAGVVLGLLVCVPVGFTMRHWLSTPYPNINDITTDFNNPPQFVDPPGLSADSMRYERARLEPLQKKYYPELGPLRIDENPNDVFAAVRAVANVPPLAGLQIASHIPSAPGWYIVYIDPATRTIEGVESSYLFRFRDDFVVQVRPGLDPNTSLVEMRSRSRDGTGDFGANYNRIREFFGMLRLNTNSDVSSPIVRAK
jgi:hypothetical protein